MAEAGLPFAAAGAVRVRGQAQFRPRRYLPVPADALEARGGRIFEGTTVRGLWEDGPCRVMTTRGRW
ncbi:FAD-dependent oxidoreductase [Streptomyces sp. SHP 1-2]|uniref:FAD-dependent oxidoreductase n=1 Tax=Streptomyces sp. SHP 1-2 TaxID=2769489 RepID=UPI0039E14E4E